MRKEKLVSDQKWKQKKTNTSKNILNEKRSTANKTILMNTISE